MQRLERNPGLSSNGNQLLAAAVHLDQQRIAFLTGHAQSAPAVSDLAFAGRDLMRKVAHALHQPLMLSRVEFQGIELFDDLPTHL